MTVTIRQYDTATSLHNPFFDQVRGTVGDVMYVNGRTVRQVNPDAPGHTFTIQTPPDTRETNLFVTFLCPACPPTTESGDIGAIPTPHRHRLPGQDGHARTSCGTATSLRNRVSKVQEGSAAHGNHRLHGRTVTVT